MFGVEAGGKTSYHPILKILKSVLFTVQCTQCPIFSNLQKTLWESNIDCNKIDDLNRLHKLLITRIKSDGFLSQNIAETDMCCFCEFNCPPPSQHEDENRFEGANR